MTTIINGSSPSITFSDSTTQASAGLTSSSTLNASNMTTGTLPAAQLPAGTVLKVVQTSITTTTSVSSTSFADIPGFSVSITPTSSSNKIAIFAVANGGNNGNNCCIRLMRDSTPISVNTDNGNRSAGSMPGHTFTTAAGLTYAINFVDSPATTSAITYKLQVTMSAGTFYLNRTERDQNSFNTDPRFASSIIVMEIAG